MSKSNAGQTDIHSFEAMEKMHDLIAGEIKLAAKEASRSVNELTKTFMDMVKDVHNILAQLELLGNEQAAVAGKQAINDTCNEFLNKVQAGTVGFQFYDKLTQRLYHATRTLGTVNKQVLNEESFADAAAWQVVWQDMEARYNTEQDREMHALVMEGKPVKEALNLAEQSGNKSDIELF